MKTVFVFCKKTALFLCVLIVAFACVLSARVAFSETRVQTRSFHFLVIERENVEAAAGLSGLDGGAGYVMRAGEGVALGVYFTLSEAREAQSNVCGDYPDAQVVSYSTRKFFFSGKGEKANANKILAAFSTLYEYLRLIYDESVRLERGGTQESSRRILTGVSDQLAFLGKENESVESALAEACSSASDELRETAEGTIYSKDLRTFLCGYAEKYLSLAASYSF